MGSSNSDEPISGYGIRLDWLRNELMRHLAAPTADIAGTRSIVAWYLRSGYDMGVPRTDLELLLAHDPQLHAIATGLSDDEVSKGKPAPALNRGDAVEVVVNAKNITYHKGHVRDVQWHYQERQWLYLITDEKGRNVSKRYIADDLRLL